MRPVWSAALDGVAGGGVSCRRWGTVCGRGATGADRAPYRWAGGCRPGQHRSDHGADHGQSGQPARRGQLAEFRRRQPAYRAVSATVRQCGDAQPRGGPQPVGDRRTDPGQRAGRGGQPGGRAVSSRCAGGYGGTGRVCRRDQQQQFHGWADGVRPACQTRREDRKSRHHHDPRAGLGRPGRPSGRQFRRYPCENGQGHPGRCRGAHPGPLRRRVAVDQRHAAGAIEPR